MKKIIMLLLIVTSLIYGQETAITTTGKKVNLNEDFTWSYIEINTEEGFDFRKTTWGMSQEEVTKSEALSPYGEPSEKILMFTGKISELDCVIVYFFTNDLLTGARYFFTEKHSNNNDYLYDYDGMKELLTKKYGVPKSDDDYWKNDLYKDDYSQWGFAISYGHYVKYATWENDKTEIEISITGENFDISHKIDYSSVELKDLKESANTTSAIEDL